MQLAGSPRALAFVAAAAALIGCGSSGGPQTGDCDAGCLPPADDAFLTSFCELVETCCHAALADGMPSDVARCKRTFATAGFSRDPALQSMCLAELRDLAKSGGAAGCVPEIWNLSDACVRLTYEPSGSVAPGAPCTQRSDCAGEAGAITLCVNVCIRMTRGKAGDATCLGDVSDLGVIIAAPESQSPQSPAIATGALCARRDGLYCAIATDKSQQACAPLRAGGVPCDFSRTCASGTCYDGDNTQGTITGTCDTVVSPRQACSYTVPRMVCDPTSHCDGDGATPGICVAGLPAGASCDSDVLCANGNCKDGKCKSTTDEQEIALFGYCTRGP